jgi:hypothetical protein
MSLSKPLSVDLNKMEFLGEFFDDDLDILEIIDVGWDFLDLDIQGQINSTNWMNIHFIQDLD